VLQIDVLANDTYPAGAETSLAIVDAPTHGVTEIIGGPRVKYTADSGFIGVDTFTYQICWEGVCEVATVTVTVTG
jgi:hypothetical protein